MIGGAGLLFGSPLAARAQSAGVTTLRLSDSPVDDCMPVLYAQHAGLFAQAGLDVTLTRANSGAAIAAAVVGGSLDIGDANIASIIAAHTRGVPLVIVAPAAIYDPKTPDAVLLVSNSSPIRTARDLVGKTIGTPALRDLSSLAAAAWLQQNRVDWHGVTFIELPYRAMEVALEAGRVDACVQVKPFITDAVDSGKARVLGQVFSAISNRFLESAWFSSRPFIEAHKDAIAKFQRVMARASAYTNAHPSETVDLLVSWTGIEAQRAASIPRIVTGTTLQARDIQPVIDAAAKYGWIDQSFDAREIIA
jgi:NitT/TauT family transport system substrate-binding protein